MYERGNTVQLVKMLERGLFPRAGVFVATEVFGLDNWKAAFVRAGEHAGIRRTGCSEALNRG